LPSSISPRDVNELAIAITELLRDRTEGNQLKHASRTVAQTLVWDAIAGAHLQIYQSALLDLGAIKR
jgi:glycosyltransferase involved in cell wall biosynthesis